MRRGGIVNTLVSLSGGNVKDLGEGREVIGKTLLLIIDKIEKSLLHLIAILKTKLASRRKTEIRRSGGGGGRGGGRGGGGGGEGGGGE